jgi:hypothetical protein
MRRECLGGLNVQVKSLKKKGMWERTGCYILDGHASAPNREATGERRREKFSPRRPDGSCDDGVLLHIASEGVSMLALMVVGLASRARYGRWGNFVAHRSSACRGGVERWFRWLRH